MILPSFETSQKTFHSFATSFLFSFSKQGINSTMRSYELFYLKKSIIVYLKVKFKSKTNYDFFLFTLLIS